MAKITVNESRCKGCELCVSACPRGLIKLDTERINAMGYHPSKLTDEEKCIGCAMCAMMCPHVAITVER